MSEAIEHGPILQDCWVPDHSDPEWALGSVLAQVEDLEPKERIRVLEDALTEVREWYAQSEVIQGFSHHHDRYGIRYLDRAPALLPEGVEVEVKYGEDRSARVQCEYDSRLRADVAYDSIRYRVTGPIGMYLITDNGWTRIRGEDIIEDKVSS